MEMNLKHGEPQMEGRRLLVLSVNQGNSNLGAEGHVPNGGWLGFPHHVVFFPHTSLGRITAYPIILVGNQSHQPGVSPAPAGVQRP